MNGNRIPVIWPELTAFFEGTSFQALAEKLSGLGFAGELITVVLIMVFSALAVSAAALVIRGGIYFLKKLLPKG